MMRFDSTLRQWKVVMTLATGLALAATAMMLRPSSPPENDKLLGVPDRTFDRFLGSGIDLVYFDNTGNVAFRLHIGEIAHRKERIGFFTINPIKILEMQDVAIELPQIAKTSSVAETPGDTRAGGVPRVSLKTVFNRALNSLPESLGFVTQLTINEFEVRSADRGTNRFTLKARHAGFKLGQSDLSLENGFRLRIADDELLGKRATLRSEKNLLQVSGNYVWRRAGLVSPGRDTVFMIKKTGIETLDPQD